MRRMFIFANRVTGNVKMILICLLFLFLIGFMMQFSASGGMLSGYASAYALKSFVGIIILVLCYKININYVYKVTDYFYAFCLFLLLLVPIIGETRLGAQRWLNLGIIYIQPSEIMKIALILTLSKHFHKFNISSIGKFKFYIQPIILTLIPFFLIAEQPDLGTALIILIIACILFFLGGFKVRYFIMVGTLILIIIPIMWFNFMHDYQKNRVLTFIDPSKDPLGSGYHIIQSKIAIGSGGFFGKGYLSGTQSQLDFLPEKHSDFVFTLLSEEFGFIGGLILLVIYSLLILALHNISNKTTCMYSKCIINGTSTIMFIYTFINIGMVSGILPVVGVPLPLISFGGTSLITLMICFGLTLNIAIKDSEVTEFA